ncbi:MAG TPA: transketolase [Firmicutes bacterium]|nr:transketolase [Bacillota bacterium]
MLTPDEERFLKGKAAKLRRLVLEAIYHAQSGHPGGSLSYVEILTVLYFHTLRFDPRHPADPGRDRFILSKGHACPALYAIFAELGIISPAELASLRRVGSRLQGHPDMTKLPGIEMSSGPLGLGLSAGLGMALAARLDKRDYRTYVVLGDGELQEGMVWEAAMAAAKFRAGNLTAIVDFNGVQLDGTTDEIMPLGDLAAKFGSFGWQVMETDGHDVNALAGVFAEAKKAVDKPVVIFARTIKGKGVSYMEGRYQWHGQVIDAEKYQLAIAELEAVKI